MKELLSENPVHEDHRKVYEGNREQWLNEVADFIYNKVEEEYQPAGFNNMRPTLRKGANSR